MSNTSPKPVMPTLRRPDSSTLYRVVKVIDPQTVVISAGSTKGVVRGQRFVVFGVAEEELFDPETRESLGRLETVRGTGFVVHVQDRLSTIRSDRFFSNGRIVTRSAGSGAIMASLLGVGDVEDLPTSQVLAFEGVAEGDYARPFV